MTIFKNPGHMFCGAFPSLDLSDCCLMISFGVNIFASDTSEVILCHRQCVPSGVGCRCALVLVKLGLIV